MECPHCGFMNLLDSGECVRCRKPLPAPPASSQATPEASPDNSLDLSEVKIQAVPDEASEPPAFPEHGEEVDVSSGSVAPVSGAGLQPAPPGEDTETADVPFPPSAAETGSAKTGATGLKPAASAQTPARDEASATYEGSDPELKELSRFFHQVREESGQAEEEWKPEEATLPPAEAEPERAEKPSRRTKAPALPVIAPTEEEKGAAPAETSDSFIPEFKEALLPGMEKSEPTLSPPESAPAPRLAGSRPGGMPLLVPRILAGLVDLVIHGLILAALCLGAVRVLGSSAQAVLLSEALLRVALPLFLVMLLIFLGYQVFFAATAGQTPGQMLLGLRVEDETGDSPTLGPALLRALVLLACLLPLGLGLLLILADPERRTLADKISRTRVTRI